MFAVKQNKSLLVLIFSLIAVMLLYLVPAQQASANVIGGNRGTVDDSQSRLRTAVDETIHENTYTSETGDTVQGRDLVRNGITTDRFSELTSKERQRLIDDMSTAVREQQSKDLENGATNPVTNNTVSNWLKDLQQQPGVGARLLSTITEQVKPDYVTANRIFEPFSSPFNTGVGLVTILLMVGITLGYTLDLSFINIPMFQAFVLNRDDAGGGGGGGRSKANFFVSRTAMFSLEQSEGASDGKFINPNFTYFKHSVISMFILGICLLYLVHGEIFALVGMFMDLLGGFLGAE